MKKIFLIFFIAFSFFSNSNASANSFVETFTVNKTFTASETASSLKKHVIVGYWHNFNNGAANGLKLSQVDNSWDVINLSFAEPTSPTSGDLVYNPTSGGIYSSEADFITDVKAVQANGKKVILSIGGANGQVRLETITARDKFIVTVAAIITKYGLDGLDVDFEGQSLSLNTGDYDFRNPTTPVIVNLIYALKALKAQFGSNFMLTMAPETFFVQLGYSYYGSLCYGCDARAGSFLPVVYAMRNDLSWLQVQYYNSGSIGSPEGSQTCGNEDFIVNLANMLMTGFEISDPQNKVTESLFFPALRPDQVVLGVPVGAGSAGSGVLTPNQYKSVFNKLLSKGYTDLRGFMTWSINWDVYNGKTWSTTLRSYIDGLNGTTGTSDTQAPSNPGNLSGVSASKSITLTWSAATDNVGVAGYNIYVGGSYNGYSVSTNYTVNSLTASTAYSIEVEAYDAAGNKSAKTSVSITTLAQTGTGTGTCTVTAWDATKNYQTPNEEVSYNGKVYKCLVWWTTAGATPDATTTQWSYVSDCGGTGSDTGTTTCTVAAWNGTKNYDVQYEEVSYKGKVYKCIVWWSTAGAAPDVTTTQWSYVSDCKGSSTDSKNIKGVNYSISPNPAIESVNIQIEANATIKIFDISGRLVYNGNLLIGTNKIDVKNYNKGLYLIKIEGDNISIKEKQLIN